MAQNGVGAVVERLKGWHDTAPTDQTRGAESSLADSSLGSWVLELCLGKEIAGACKVLEKILIIESTESSSFCKNSFGKTIGAQKLPQPGKDQCLPSAVHGVRGVQRVAPWTMLLQRHLREAHP
jgi:hypothetical protein